MSTYAPPEGRSTLQATRTLQRQCGGGAGCAGESRWGPAGDAQGRLQAALDGSPRVLEQAQQAEALSFARGLGVQPQLTIGAPDDPFEQEADRVARQVVSDINGPPPEPAQEDELMRKPAPSISRVSAGAPGGEMPASPELEASIGHARAGGEALPDVLRGRLEDSLGADLGGVRVHRDAQADQLNRQIQAKAFTSGQDVFFRKGLYNPGSRGGQELLAHELTHVVQQGGDAIQRRTIRRVIYPTVNALLTAALGGAPPNFIDPEVQALFADAENQLPLTDVISVPGLNRVAEATPTPGLAHPYRLQYNPNEPNEEWLISSILHELIHVSSAENYDLGGAAGLSPWTNLNLPPGLAGAGLNNEVDAQEDVLNDNLQDLDDTIANDNTLGPPMQHFLQERVAYAAVSPARIHYDTVIADMITYMELMGYGAGPTFAFLRRLSREANDRRLVAPWWGTKRTRRVDANAGRFAVWKW
jgi:hypothetical protein